MAVTRPGPEQRTSAPHTARRPGRAIGAASGATLPVPSFSVITVNPHEKPGVLGLGYATVGAACNPAAMPAALAWHNAQGRTER